MTARGLTGMKFGRLTVLERAGSDKYRYALWRCVCECGGTSLSRSSHLLLGEVRSCGCLQREARERSGQQTRHGHYAEGYPSSTYISWRGMKSRCLNANDPYFHRYGGRGIAICSGWLAFEGFLADMGERPSGLTLDRIDPDGNYEPANCRWATPKEQAVNRSTVVWPRAAAKTDEFPAWVTADWLRMAAAYLDRAKERAA